MSNNTTVYDYDRMLEAMKAKPGEWILAFEGAPVSMLKRLWRRDMKALSGIEAKAMSFSIGKTTTVSGRVRGEIWARWNLTPAGSLIPGLEVKRGGGAASPEARTIRINRAVAHLAGDALPSMVEAAVKKLAEGTATLPEVPVLDTYISSSLPKETLAAAREFANDSGVTLGTAVTALIVERFADRWQ